MMRERRPHPRRRDGDPLAAAIARRDWELVALYILLGVALTSHDDAPSLDDVLDALAGREVRDERAGA